MPIPVDASRAFEGAVVLKTVWFNVADDPSDSLRIPFATQINPAPQTKGETREYGAGRFRAVLSGATQKSQALAFDACGPDLVARLIALDGVALWYRDDSGEKFHGVYLSPQITRHRYDANADVTLTFVATTGTEEV